ncbi:MAG TPA: hypothetical protein IAB12_03230 [Candidatus Ornithospirochaeta avicola]|uniref:Uncharacterized protein n=1 Tax=Candidatus Ornithospirochaeta avicola TaxID=2840896 RepID=A0A9D1PT05_9SPIO|nr:hypothetical protein [Candidatus Ornithospirochaeta avicola]
MEFSYDCSWESGGAKQHQAYSAPSGVDMNAREQSAAIKKTVVETFPISKEKAPILSVIRSWGSLPLVLPVSTGDSSITHVMSERFMDIEAIIVCLLEQQEVTRNRQFLVMWQVGMDGFFALELIGIEWSKQHSRILRILSNS